jgi:hypothetical protein
MRVGLSLFIEALLRRGFRLKELPYGLIVALLAALVPLGWAGVGRVIAGVDTPPIVDYGLLVKTTSNTWDPTPNGGISNYVGYGMYWPILLGGAFLQRVAHLPAWVIGAALLSLSWALAAAGAYSLAAELRARASVRVAAAVAYTFNFAHTLIAPGLHGMIAYGVLPWFAVALLAGLRSDMPRRVALAGLSALATTLLIYVKINPPSYITLWLGGIVVAAICAVTVRARVRPLLEWLVPFVALTLIFNAWWLYDFWLAMKLDVGSVTAQLDTQWVSRSSTIGQVLLLGGSWALDGAVDPGSPFSYAPWYRLPVVQSLLALFPAGVLLAAMCSIGSRAVRIVIVAILLVIFVDAGYHEPFGGLFTWCFDHIPGFWLFREPLTKFDGVAALLYVVAVIIAFRDAAPSMRRIVGSLIAVACLGAVVGGIPAIEGTVVRHDTAAGPGWRVAVPQYWLRFARYMNERTGGRLIVYPEAPFYQLGYSWGYAGTDINGMLLRHPFIDVTSSNSYTDSAMRVVELAWYDALKAPETDAENLRLLTDQLSIGYLVDRADTVGVDRPLKEPLLQARLRAIGFRYSRSFGPLRLYERSEPTETREARLEIQPFVLACGEPNLLALRQYIPVNGVVLRSPWSGCAGVESVLRPLPGATFAVFSSVHGAHARFISGDPRVRIDAQPRSVVPGEALFAEVSGGNLRRVRDHDYVGEIGPSVSEIDVVRSRRLREIRATSTDDVTLPVARFGMGTGLIEIQPDLSAPTKVSVDVAPDSPGGDTQHQTAWYSPFEREGPVFRVSLGKAIHISLDGTTAPVSLKVREFVVLSEGMVPLRVAGYDGKPLGSAAVSLRKSGIVEVPLHGPGAFHVSAALRASQTVEFRSADAADRGRLLARVGPGESDVRFEAINVTATLVPSFTKRGTTATVMIKRVGLAPWAVYPEAGRVVKVMEATADETGSTGSYEANGSVAAHLPQAFSNGWRLFVDDRLVPHRTTIAVENAWLLPAGRHRYRLEFEPQQPATILKWLAIACAFIVVTGASLVLLRKRQALAAGGES